MYRMTSFKTERRNDALTKAKIVEAAIALLDDGGESALTFRALAAHLATGAGAIYWHVADKSDLLTAATDHIIADLLTAEDAEPRAAIRTLALGVFDAIDAHPWVGAHLARAPWQNAMLEIFERVGAALQALSVPEHAQFDAASALLSYMLGVAGQNAANARLLPPGTDRATSLAGIAARWTQAGPEAYPFVHRIAAQMRDHDDRAQFLAGIDLILTGISQL